MEVETKRKKYLKLVNDLKKLLEYNTQEKVKFENNKFSSLDGTTQIDMDEYKKAESEYFETINKNN